MEKTKMSHKPGKGQANDKQKELGNLQKKKKKSRIAK